jgi:hypothetical protein
VGARAGLDAVEKENILFSLAGIEPVLPVARRYTDWAIRNDNSNKTEIWTGFIPDTHEETEHLSIQTIR